MLGPVAVADYLQRETLLQRQPDGSLTASTDGRWAGSLSSDIDQLLLRQLAWKLDSQRVVMAPAAANFTPDVQVVLSITRLDSGENQPAVLDAQWRLLDRRGTVRDSKLIHLEEPIRDRPTWQQWFGHFGLTGLPLEGGLRLNDYALVLQAAMAGEGFAFGWKHVTDPLVTQGLLAAKRDWIWESGRGFYLVWSRKSPLGPEAERVRDWILDRVQADMAAKSER